MFNDYIKSVTPKVRAVDFDGTLYSNAFPEIGITKPKNQLIIDYIHMCKAEGDIICLWTCREDTPE